MESRIPTSWVSRRKARSRAGSPPSSSSETTRRHTSVVSTGEPPLVIDLLIPSCSVGPLSLSTWLSTAVDEPWTTRVGSATLTGRSRAGQVGVGPIRTFPACRADARMRQARPWEVHPGRTDRRDHRRAGFDRGGRLPYRWTRPFCRPFPPAPGPRSPGPP
ncbi:hypothetical protein [Ornithinimicrobium kibberense]|uniref:hypothetical protein n=1 Tax=Ornithinimicrobium kibberense TaxID=282060 RepID=UPI003621F19A